MQLDDSSSTNQLEEFYQNLEEVVIDQARRILNLSIYNKAVLSTLPMALVTTDIKGCINTVNKASVDLLGVDEKVIKGKLLIEFLGQNEDIAKAIQKAFSTGYPQHIAAKNLILSSGKEIVGNLNFQAIFDDEENICGLIMIIEDQTYIHFLHNAFKRYVPSSVSEIIAKNPEKLKLGGEEKVLSVLFSDLIGFTTFAEKYSPQDIITFLSEYFSEMTEQIFAFQGTLKEYVADELMAIFGAPIYQEDHANKACLSALAMHERLCAMNDAWSKKKRPLFNTRIGINSGAMLVGNIGSPYRFSYGVLGDQVNLASRLEGLNNIYGTKILIGEATANLVKDNFILREIDSTRVKGKHNAIKIYELIAASDSGLSFEKKISLSLYAEGLSFYREQKWEKAINSFKDSLKLIKGGDTPSDVMLKRCQEFIDKPYMEEWDGIFQQITKK